jgi:hypothetical protein
MNDFGIAWVAMAGAFGLHVADEVSTDFLSWYNPTARRIRARLGGLPFPPVFSFWPWLLGLSAATAILFALTPWAFARAAWLVPIAVAFSIINIGNGLLHILASVRLGRRVPGLISAPLLLACAVWLLFAAVRTN